MHEARSAAWVSRCAVLVAGLVLGGCGGANERVRASPFDAGKHEDAGGSDAGFDASPDAGNDGANLAPDAAREDGSDESSFGNDGAAFEDAEAGAENG